MTTDVESLLNEAMAELSHPREVNIDRVIDHLIAIVFQTGRLEAIGHDEIAFTLGKNLRKFVRFDDCVGRLRMILARLFIRCQESYPRQLNGNLYGFESDVLLTFGEQKDSVELFVKTKNNQAYPELLMESKRLITGEERG